MLVVLDTLIVNQGFLYWVELNSIYEYFIAHRKVTNSFYILTWQASFPPSTSPAHISFPSLSSRCLQCDQIGTSTSRIWSAATNKIIHINYTSTIEHLLNSEHLRSGPCSTVAPQPTAVQIVPGGGPHCHSGPAVSEPGRQIGLTQRLNWITGLTLSSERSFFISDLL